MQLSKEEQRIFDFAEKLDLTIIFFEDAYRIERKFDPRTHPMFFHPEIEQIEIWLHAYAAGKFSGTRSSILSPTLDSTGSDGRILQAGTEQCVRFAQEVFNAIWPNGDIDGGHLQELGEKHGLLTPVKVTEPCGDACGCKDFISEAEFAEGHECFKKHSILLGETK